MFIRKVKNRSGSQSVQVIQKIRGRYKVIKTIGCATMQHEIEKLEKSAISLKRASELTRNMYQITYTLPESKQTKSKLLNMDEEQAELYRIVFKNF